MNEVERTFVDEIEVERQSTCVQVKAEPKHVDEINPLPSLEIPHTAFLNRGRFFAGQNISPFILITLGRR